MSSNTVEVTVTVTAGGREFTKSATGGSSDNPFRLADQILNVVSAEVSKEMSEPRIEWDVRQKPATRRYGRGL